MNLPPELEEIYPAMRLVSGGYVKLGDLDHMSIDDLDDLTITISAEADAVRRARTRIQGRSR